MAYVSIILTLFGLPLWFTAMHRGKGGEVPFLLLWIITSVVAIVLAMVAIVRNRKRSRPLSISTGALMLSFLSLGTFFLYAPAIAQRGSNRLPCPSNLKQIGSALLLYSLDHGGRYPHRLEDLVSANFPAKSLICPDSSNTPAQSPADLQSPGHQHCSYIFLAADGLASDYPEDAIIAYEPLSNHVDGSNILRGDGSVVFLPAADLSAQLSHTTSRPTIQTSPSSN